MPALFRVTFTALVPDTHKHLVPDTIEDWEASQLMDDIEAFRDNVETYARQLVKNTPAFKALGVKLTID